MVSPVGKCKISSLVQCVCVCVRLFVCACVRRACVCIRVCVNNYARVCGGGGGGGGRWVRVCVCEG